MAPVHRKIQLALDINAPPADVFAAIVDLPSYNTWLPQSGVFKGTTEVSESPVKAGTKYQEHSPSGTRYGEVQLLDSEQRHVVFHQPMKLTPSVLGLELDVTVDMIVRDSEGGGCRLEREIRLGLPPLLRLAPGLVEKQFREESWRTMLILKEHLESKKA